MNRLANKTAIVTGAGTGIGRACALALAREGAGVVLVGRRQDRLHSVAREIGDLAWPVAGDVSQASQIRQIVRETNSRFGTVHVLINNAGILHMGNAEQISEQEWDETFKVNVGAAWLFSRAVLPDMRKAGGGSIINMASVLGINGAPQRAAYAASKGALVLLTKCMAIDHAVDKIRVNAICPGFVETELTAAVLASSPDAEGLRRERIRQHPMGRLGQAQDISGLAVYLASDESAWVTGSVFPVDGGYLAI